ncbi:ABC transporter permease [Virgibacillus soli]|uniref:ABC transporter permease n=1 Tax=Paracerasibacillus soli TaxID=480284 RepID=A0ABU5CRX3_9BACI|nr:ABC transporter permease [Virgibacillus soli]MDY0408626.1 ABC transporter permease [Virgibacillus soli]
MKHIFITRFYQWKKQPLSLFALLLLPIIATIFIVHIFHELKDDTKIPVGIVLEEDTSFATSIVDALQQSPLVRITELQVDEALHQLETHQLDSVFIIKDGYEELIHKGMRNQLLVGYQSNLSFAYAPVKETLLSIVQQDAGRSKAAHTVLQLANDNGYGDKWTWEDITMRSKQTQDEENLISTSFSFDNQINASTPSNGLLNPWTIWAAFSMVCTFLIFDWVIREKSTFIYSRYAFMKDSYAVFIIKNLIIYFLLFLICDLATIAVFHYSLNQDIQFNILWQILSFRFIVILCACIIANNFKKVFAYYGFSLMFSILCMIFSGNYMEKFVLQKLTWMNHLNPLAVFQDHHLHYVGITVYIVFFFIWFTRKELSNA